MPRDITITLEDGETHVYKNAPDDITPEAVTARAQKEFGKAVTNLDGGRSSVSGRPSSLVDAVRSIPGGLAQGANAALGFPGDLKDLLGKGTNAVLNFVTGQDKKFEDVKAKMPGVQPATSSDLNKFVSEPFGGYYKPETTAGEYAQTIASFAPAALAPGNVAQRLARVAVPGAASETGGQLTKGTPLEPWARVGGALIGGVGLGVAEDQFSKVAAKRAAPSNVDLRDEANALYKSADAAGVTIKSSAYSDLADDISSTVKAEGMHPKLHPKIDGVLDSLNEVKGKTLSLGEVERLRRVAGIAAKSMDADERRIAGIIINKIDDFQDGLDHSKLISGNADAGKVLGDARGLWSKMRKSQTIDDLIERAQTRATAANGNIAAALRQEFGTFARNKKLMRGFSPSERSAIQEMARAGPTKSVMIGLGALRPRGLMALGQAMGSGMAIGASNPLAAAPVLGTAAVGQLSQSLLNKMTKADADLVSALMRGGPGTTAAVGAPSVSKEAIISALLANPMR